MSKPMIDIIVTHYDEPWDVGRKFFLMLSLQRNIRMEDIRVLLVQDGKEGALKWDELFQSCPYEVSVLTSGKPVGPADARNIGIENAEAEWVMFCDFDDMFSDVYSMSLILNVLPTNEADILWFECYREQNLRAKSSFVNCVNENFGEVYGKLFRRKFLLDNHIQFDSIRYEYDYIFGMISLACCKNNRTMKITTPFGLYSKTMRPGSYTKRKETVTKQIESIFYADLVLTEEFRKRMDKGSQSNAIARTIFDAYFILNCKPSLPRRKEMLDLFAEYYHEYKDVFDRIRQSEMETIEAYCNNRMINTVVNLYNDFLIEAVTPDTGIQNVRNWLASIPLPEYVTKPPLAQEPEKKNERVVVYTGTRNVYENILASMKSLFANTTVDKVYLMIEDDTFPYDVPDCVTVMNVSGQKYFPETGPNYNNSWTYMCMIRAAFPELLPQHDRILSLDIDTVILDNIDGLWNTDISGYYLAGVHENDRPDDYINFGVVLMNLRKMRTDGIQNRVIHLLNSDKLQCPEQDAFNKICTGNILLVPSCYNYTPYTHLVETPENERIIHYAGIQYWKNFPTVQKYLNMPWSKILSGICEQKEPEEITSRPPMHSLDEYSYQRYDIINRFIRERHYKSFLEIGTRKGETFNRVIAPVKVSVDPDPETDATYHMTSDEYFDEFDDTFDIIFIDGLHEHNQVWRDVKNALEHLNRNGVVIMHDCNPANEHEQRYLTADPYTDVWQGTTWKAYVKARKVFSCEMCVLVAPYGDHTCGIIDTSRKKTVDTSALPHDMDAMTYNDFVSHPEWMNFKKTYNYSWKEE